MGRMIQAPRVEHEETGLGLKGGVSGSHDSVGRERREVQEE